MGSVTNPTGSIKGRSLTGLADAYTGNWSGTNGTYDSTTTPNGATLAQAQHLVLLSDKPGACSREGAGGAFAPGEVTLRFIMLAYDDLPDSITTIPPSADLPLAFSTGVWQDTSEGTHRRATATYMVAKSNGAAGTDQQATSGVVIFTRMDATTYEGTYDLWFGADHVTGTFSAPWC